MHNEPIALRATSSFLRVVFLFAAVLVLGVACGPPPAVTIQPDGGAEEVDVELEVEVEIVITEADGSTSTWTPARLFERAKGEFRDGDFVTAAKHFELVADSATDASGYIMPALFNAGASYEQLGEYEAARVAYTRMVERDGDSDDGVDAAFRLAEIFSQQGRWDAVRDTMATLVERERIKVAARTQGHYRLGFAELTLGQIDAAEETFRKGLITNRSAGRGALPDNHYFVAGLEYGLALVDHTRFSRVKLRQPPEEMKRGYREKKVLSKKAYNQYNRVIVFRNSYWSILAAYQIGKLFEDYYYDLLSAEVPEGVEGDELDAYFAEWREELRPFLDEAIKMYEAIYELSQGTPEENNPWVLESYARLQRLQGYLDDDDAHRQEEAIILELSESMRRGPELLMQPRPDLTLPTPKNAEPHGANRTPPSAVKASEEEDSEGTSP